MIDTTTEDLDDRWQREALTQVSGFNLPQPAPLTNERLWQFNQHILLTVQAVQNLHTALRIIAFS
jgi:hypothetical protein